MPHALYIPRARLLDPATGTDRTGELYVDPQGRIAPRPDTLPEGCVTFTHAGELLVTPGLCDLHVHFRDPGQTASEDLASGAAAAANGGFTRVVTMPNTLPATDSPELVARAKNAALPVSIYPSACCTRARNGKVPAELEALAEAGASCFTDDGSMVSNPEVMEAVMRRAKALGRVVMDHAVRPEIQQGGVIRECPLAERLGLKVFPAEAEIQAVRDDIAVCRRTGCPLHIQHISCAETVRLVAEARREGLPVTAEITPHHLALAAEEIPGDDANWRMNPPLGTRADRAALRQALLDGTVAIFATDHAPHTPESKSQGFGKGPFGIIGLETAFAVTWHEMVLKEGLAPLAWAAYWITNPNRLLGLTPPTLEVGQAAELALFAPDLPWQVTPQTLASKSHDTPWLNQTLTGRCLATYRNGTLRHTTGK